MKKIIMRILTISGFAQDPAIISNSLDTPSIFLDYQSVTPSNIESYLADYKNFDTIHAWSLGTLIAINYAHILKPKKLILYAPIYQYIASKDFSYGIEQTEFNSFKQKLIDDEQSWFNYFCILIAKGSPNFRSTVKRLRSFDISKMKHNKEWLDYLAATQANLSNIKGIDTIAYHGDQDQVVSYKQSEFIKKILPEMDLNLIESASHSQLIE